MIIVKTPLRASFVGNCDSGTTASYFVCDLNEGCCLDLAKKTKVICLKDNLPGLLAYASDISYESVFVKQLKIFLKSVSW